jgi:uncharacterized membrane protein
MSNKHPGWANWEVIITWMVVGIGLWLVIIYGGKF